MLINNVDLSIAIDRCVPYLEKEEDIVTRGWRYEPPKALSDVFESVVGAILVDSNYDYDITSVVVEHVMMDVLVALSPSLRRDPVSELTEWTAGAGCRKKIVYK